MTTAEGRLIARIREMEQVFTKRLQSAADSEKEALEKWVNDYISGLNVEIPFSVKQILNGGGAVRSFVVELMDHPLVSRFHIYLQVDGTKEGDFRRQVELPELERPKPKQKYRLTIFVEPVE